MMDVPFAIQQYLLTIEEVTELVGSNIFLLEIPQSSDLTEPFMCTVVRAGGGAARYGSGTLELNDLRIVMASYGPTLHLAYNIDGAIYEALKTLTPSVWGSTYLHWVKPAVRPIALRDPDLQWPYVVSSWQTLASDITIPS